MKHIYIFVFIIITISCAKKKEQIETTAVKTQGVEEPVVEQKTVLISLDTNAFLAEVNNTKVRQLPVFEHTNFDSFIEPEDYNEVNVKALQLEQIYSNFYDKDHNFKTYSSYRIQLSETFYTIVVALQKTDNEMESRLINYDLKGNIIDSKVVAYDEIAEGMSQIKSRITENRLVVHHIFWSEQREVESVDYQIESNGKIKELFRENLNDSIENYTLIDSVLIDLKLNWTQIKTNLVIAKENPSNTTETIVVIPVIIDEGDHYFELSSYIVLVNTISGKITHRYFKNSKTNGWVSNAIKLDRIEVDTTSYLVSNAQHTIAVSVHYHGYSKANPYYRKSLSWFVKTENQLKNILPNFVVEEYTGEWNGTCKGDFLNTKRELIITENTTNNYFDFLVSTKVSTIKNFENENGECDEKESVVSYKSNLIFNRNTYIKK